jgi:hypothetical protein
MSTTTNLALNEPAYNSTSPTWDQPLNYNSTILDQMFGNTTGVSVNTGGSTTYTNITAPSATAAGSTSQAMRFNLTGALAANQNVLLPQGVAGMWIVSNNTSGAYTVSIGSNNGSNVAAGTTVSVPQGYSSIVFSDATNVKLSDDGILQGGNIAGNLTVGGSITAGTTVSDSIGNLRNIPQNAQSSSYVLVVTDNGKCISITTGGVTVPSGIFSTGQNVAIYNNSSSNQTLTQGSSVTLRLAGTTNTGNRTLLPYSLSTVFCVASNTFVVAGSGVY